MIASTLKRFALPLIALGLISSSLPAYSDRDHDSDCEDRGHRHGWSFSTNFTGPDLLYQAIPLTINERGTVVAAWYDEILEELFFFTQNKRGVNSPLEVTLPGLQSFFPTGIDSSGRVFGSYTDGDGVGRTFLGKGADWMDLQAPDGRPTSPVAIASNGLALLVTQNEDFSSNYYVWKRGTFKAVPALTGFTGVNYLSINAEGDLLGTGQDEDGVPQYFAKLSDKKKPKVLPTPPGANIYTQFTQITDDGEVTGYFVDLDVVDPDFGSVPEAFILDGKKFKIITPSTVGFGAQIATIAGDYMVGTYQLLDGNTQSFIGEK